MSLFDDAIGLVSPGWKAARPTFDPKPGSAYTTRMPAVEHLNAETESVADGYRVTVRWDTPRVVNGLRFEVRVLRDGREVMRFTTADTQAAFTLAEQGQYTLTVCGLGDQGERGEPVSVDVSVAVPPAPQSVEMVAGYFQLTAVPRLAGYTLHTEFEFWFTDQQITDIRAVTDHAVHLGTGSMWVHDNLLPGTTYWFYVRSVNAVGRSGFVEATGTPRSDAEGMLPIFREKIDKSWLGTAFYKTIDNGELQEDFTRIEKTVTDTKSEIEQTVNKTLGDQTATIQQISEAQASAGDKLNVMWSVKLQQMEDGRLYMAGLAAGIENTPDGMQSQLLMAADRIAMINPADGNTTPLFVAQNNQLIMNDVFLKNLSAAQITSSGNPPSFSLTPEGRLTAKNADIAGTFTATSGYFSNVVIDNTCDVQHLRAEAIDGDLVNGHQLPEISYTPAQGDLGKPYTRDVAITVVGGQRYPCTISLPTVIAHNTSDSHNGAMEVQIIINGAVVSTSLIGLGGYVVMTASYDIPAGASNIPVVIRLTGIPGGKGTALNVRPSTVFVFRQRSGGFA